MKCSFGWYMGYEDCVFSDKKIFNTLQQLSYSMNIRWKYCIEMTFDDLTITMNIHYNIIFDVEIDTNNTCSHSQSRMKWKWKGCKKFKRNQHVSDFALTLTLRIIFGLHILLHVKYQWPLVQEQYNVYNI